MILNLSSENFMQKCVFTFLFHHTGTNFVVKLILQSILYFVSQKVCASTGCPININVNGNGGTKVIKTILFSSLDGTRRSRSSERMFPVTFTIYTFIIMIYHQLNHDTNRQQT